MSYAAAPHIAHTQRPYQTEQLTVARDSAQPSTSKATEDGGFSFFGKDGFNFWDIVDVVNPLQHIPVISNVYRAITGDEIGAAAKIAGGALFGGGIGAAFQAADVAVEAFSGKDMGGHAVALATGGWEGQPNSSNTAFASAAEAPAPHAAPSTPVERYVLSEADLEAFRAQQNPPPAHTAAVRPEPSKKIDISASASPSILKASPPKDGFMPLDKSGTGAFFPMVSQPHAFKAIERDTAVGFMPLNRKEFASSAQDLMKEAQKSTKQDTKSYHNVIEAGNNFIAAQEAGMHVKAIAVESADDTAKRPDLQNKTDADWFAASMMGALNRYEQASGAL